MVSGVYVEAHWLRTREDKYLSGFPTARSSPRVPGRSSLRKPAMTRFRCALSPQASISPTELFLNLLPPLVSPDLSTFVFPTQLLKLVALVVSYTELNS